QSHSAARRASFEIGILWILIVEDFHDFLRLEGHLVRGTVAEVDHLFRMADGPISALFLMSCVGSGGRVPETYRLRHVICESLDRARESSVSDAQEFAVPIVRG